MISGMVLVILDWWVSFRLQFLCCSDRVDSGWLYFAEYGQQDSGYLLIALVLVTLRHENAITPLY